MTVSTRILAACAGLDADKGQRMQVPPSVAAPFSGSVPFSRETSLKLFGGSQPASGTRIVLPAFIRDRDTDTTLQPKDDVNRFLQLELKTPKLDTIVKQLWLAGLPRCARSLHRQKLVGRTILITEDPNEHIVWAGAQILIKPLPGYLLDYDFWVTYLCGDKELYEAASGLIMSYAWLICYESDLRIAKDEGLLPKTVQWIPWTAFLREYLVKNNPDTLETVPERYKYGELRLSRLNSLYRFTSWSLKNLVRGYMSSSTGYKEFFARNFAWLLAVFVYITVVLSAMQVGLATKMLEDNDVFHGASYGFAVASLVAVVGTVLVIFTVWLVLFFYHLLSTWGYYQNMSRKREKQLQDSLSKT